MKKIVSIMLALVLLVGCLPITVMGTWAGDRVEKITYYYNNGYYCEAIDELNWLNASGDRSVWSQEQINETATLLAYFVENVSHIYNKFGLIKSYLNQGFYYEAIDELNWLKAGFMLAPTEEKIWGEYNLDATTGISNYEKQVEEQKNTSQTYYEPSTTYSANYGLDDSATVYTTKTGSKYHRAGCSSLRRSSYATTVSSARSRGYTPCSNCRP